MRGFICKKVLQKKRLAEHEYRQHNAMTTSLLELMRAAYYDQIADRTTTALAHGDLPTMFKELRRIRAKPMSRKTRILDDSGQPTTSYNAERKRFRRYFSELLDGFEVSPMALVQQEREQRLSSTPVSAAMTREDLPTLPNLALRFATARVARTCGMDRVPPAAFKAAPWELARAYFPLIVKAHLSLRPPLQWRGGALVELAKVGGCPHECRDMRDITITDFVGGAMVGMMRPQLTPAVSRLASTGQFGGGFNGGSTEVAHVLLQSVLASAAVSNQCAIAVFVDVATAFTSMARRFVLPTSTSDEAWAHTVRYAGFTEDETNEIYNEAIDIARWGQAGASSHTVAMATAFQEHT